MAEIRIVVVGAGVSGLTCALLLSKHPRYKVTVVAKHMPGDYDIEYASPWAGANYLPVSQAGTEAAEHDKNTWPELDRLAREQPEAGVHFLDHEYFHNLDVPDTIKKWQGEIQKEDPWFKDMLPNFHPLTGPSLRNHAHGLAFTSVCINVPLYLSWLQSQCLSAGVVFKRVVIPHITDAIHLFSSSDPTTSPLVPSNPAPATAASPKADLIVNCTGLSSHSLGGVEDKALYPARGQIVLVRNAAPAMMAATGGPDLAGPSHLRSSTAQEPDAAKPPVAAPSPNAEASSEAKAAAEANSNGKTIAETSESDSGSGSGSGAASSAKMADDELCYIMTRAVGGGTVLGGCYQRGNWSGEIDYGLAERIMRRAVALCPELVGGRWGVGGREGEMGGRAGEDGLGGREGKEGEVSIKDLDVVRHGVGLRPCREGGVRLEREAFGRVGGASKHDGAADGDNKNEGEGKVWVVHDYGHGGYGYQSSYGCAEVVVRLVGECVEEMKGAMKIENGA